VNAFFSASSEAAPAPADDFDARCPDGLPKAVFEPAMLAGAVCITLNCRLDTEDEELLEEPPHARSAALRLTASDIAITALAVPTTLLRVIRFLRDGNLSIPS
jgi:hypothetical protein